MYRCRETVKCPWEPELEEPSEGDLDPGGDEGHGPSHSDGGNAPRGSHSGKCHASVLKSETRTDYLTQKK